MGPVCQIVPVAARPGEMPRFPNVEEGATIQSETPSRDAAEGSMLLRGVDSSRGGDNTAHNRHAAQPS